MSTKPQELRIHEWLAVLSILSLLIVLTLVSRITEDGSLPTTREPPQYIVDQKIDVFVEGAVENPGKLIVIKGSLVEDVLEQAKLLPEADVSKLKLESKVRRGQQIRVPVKKVSKKT